MSSRDQKYDHVPLANNIVLYTKIFVSVYSMFLEQQRDTWKPLKMMNMSIALIVLMDYIYFEIVN